MTRLLLNENQLTGSIPPELGQLTNVQVFGIGDNPLTGSIPPQLSNLTSAYIIDLKNCQLTGSIPTSFGGLTSLLYLHLDHNQLSGEIPTQLGNITNLRYLELQNNQLSGSIPTSLANLNELIRLTLSSNQLSGTIPAQLGSMPKLSRVRLDHNQLTGSIPSQLGNGIIYLLYLNDNLLTGSIPGTLGNLSDTMWYLSLENNQLSGSIPSAIGNLVELIHLDLSGNQLSGNVPASFANLTKLCGADNSTWYCTVSVKTDLGYNRLTVPATEPPAGFLAAKDPDWYTTQWQRAYIPNLTGGSVLSYDGKTLITVPAGAAGADFYLEYTPMRAPTHPVEPLASANRSFDLSAFDIQNNPITQFTLPLTIRVTYDEEKLENVKEYTVGLYYWNTVGASWEDAASTCPGGVTSRNLGENWISLPVCHLCEYGLLGTGLVKNYLPMLLR